MQHLAVEQLVALGAGLGEDRPPELGVGEEVLVLALVDEAAPPAVDHQAVVIAQAVGAVGVLARREVAPVGADRRGVAAAPLPPRHGADRHRHAQPVALVVRRAAHLGGADQRADMLRAHLHVGLEAAAAEHDRLGMDGLEPVWPSRLDAGDAAAAIEDQLGGGAGIADLDAPLSGGGKPRARQADALVHRAHDEPARPHHHVALLDARHGDRRLHLHAADLVHPEHGVLRTVDQDARQQRVRAPAGHTQQIVHVVLARVGRDAFVEALVLPFDARQ